MEDLKLVKALKDMAAPECRISTGLMVSWKQYYCFATSQPAYWEKTSENKTIIHCIGIGGGLEGNEGFMEAVQREALEESSASIRIMEPPAKKTLYWGHNQEPMWMVGPWSDSEVSPLLVWQREWIVRKPNQEPYLRKWFTPVYWAEFQAEPQASMENPAIIFVPKHLFPCLLHPMSYEQAEQEGIVVRGTGIPPFDKMVIGLSGSAYYTAQVWDKLMKVN